MKEILIKFLFFIIAVSLCIITIFNIVKNTDLFHHYSYEKYSRYDNFKDYQDDFNAVKGAVYQCGNGTYYITCSNKNRSDKSITDETEITIVEIDSRREVELSESEKNSVRNVMNNSSRGTAFCWIMAEDDYFYWQCDATGSGIIYTENIKDTVKYYDELTHKKHGYSELCGNWYRFYI